jgi:hypothetical protein
VLTDCIIVKFSSYGQVTLDLDETSLPPVGPIISEAADVYLLQSRTWRMDMTLPKSRST